LRYVNLTAARARDSSLGACPACLEERRRPWFSHPRLTLWLCGRCGLGYSDPQPRGFVEQRYLHEYDLAAHFGKLEARKNTLIERRLDELAPPSGRRRLLDVGCADGQFAAAAQARGWHPAGVELNPPAARRARERGVEVSEGHLEDVALGDGAFDLITAWDVIEHVPEPREFAQKITRLLARDGRAVVTTLNRRALVAQVFRGRWTMVVEDHFTYWHERSLHSLFASSGLESVHSSSFGLGRDFVAWLDRPPVARAGEPQVGDRSGVRARWDTRPVVLAAENALNRALDVTALGVGIQVSFRHRR